jgi:hypothetical protein
MEPKDLFKPQKKYLKTDKGRKAHRKAQNRYNATDKAKEADKRYESTEAARERKRRWARENRKRKKESGES